MSFEEWWTRQPTPIWRQQENYELAKAAWEAAYQSALVEIWKRQAEERDGEEAESARG